MKPLNHNQEKRILLIFVILFLILRLLIILTDISQIWNFEELYAGGLAHGIITGPLIKPISNYQQSPWEVGHLLGGFLAIPFFLLFGQSLVSLKLLPMAFSLGTFVVWFLFLKKFFSPKAALISGLLFLFPPPYYTKLTLIFWSSHCEASFFSALTLFIFFNIFFENKNYLKHFIFFGLFSGFGFCFSYIHVITVITCIIFWYLIDKLFIFKKPFGYFVIGLTIGLIPWSIYNLSSGFRGFYVYGKPIIEINYNLSNLVLKFKAIITYAIPDSFGFTFVKIRGFELFSNLYLIVFLISFVFLIYNMKNSSVKLILALIPSERFNIDSKNIPKELLFVIYIPLFIIMLTLSSLYSLPSSFASDNPGSLVYNYRYIIPLFPFLFAVIAIGFSNIKFSKKSGMIIPALFIIYLVTIGIYENSKLISPNKLAKGFIFKGYDYYLPLERKFKSLKSEKDIIEGLNILKMADEEYKLVGYNLIGEQVGYNSGGVSLKALTFFEKINPENKQFYTSGLGKSLASIYKYRNGLPTDEIINKIPSEYIPFIFEGYGKELGRKYQNFTFISYDPKTWLKVKWDISVCIDKINKLDERYKRYAYIGLGEHICLWDLYNHLYIGTKIISNVDDKYKPYCYLGYALELGRMRFGFVAESEELCFIQGINKKFFSLHKIPKKLNNFYTEELHYIFFDCIEIANIVKNQYKPYIYKGIGIAVGENFHDLKTLKFLKDRVEKKYLQSFMEGIEKGMP